MQATEDKDYLPKRKALSAAFFKKKLSLIIEIVKQVTIGYLSETKQKTEIDLYQFTTELMGRIIVNIAVGKGQAATLIDHEKEDGTVIKLSIPTFISRLTDDTIKRAF